jgi:hypothetical protein
MAPPSRFSKTPQYWHIAMPAEEPSTASTTVIRHVHKRKVRHQTLALILYRYRVTLGEWAPREVCNAEVLGTQEFV